MSNDLIKELRETAGDAGNGLDRESRAALDEAADKIPDLVKALEEMTQTFKPFTSMPVGAPNSVARADQDHEIAVYKRATAALAAYRAKL